MHNKFGAIWHTTEKWKDSLELEQGIKQIIRRTERIKVQEEDRGVPRSDLVHGKREYQQTNESAQETT